MQQVNNDWLLEQAEWLEALEEIIEDKSSDDVKSLFTELRKLAARKGVTMSGTALNTPFTNTIHPHEQPKYPGDHALEQRIENLNRWNAMAMVLQGADSDSGVGGHISTYAACATMYEVALNHFIRRPSADYGGDLMMIQGHAAPGIYARSFLEGRLNSQNMSNFRRELGKGGGLASYPHPRRMPDYWDFPSVSMGLGSMMGIYQARYQKYLEGRGLKPKNGGKVWCFLGDGEMDEPEIYGTVGLGLREKLDNIIFVINCNLQRLDGPVRGNGKVIQEHERQFLGFGWEVIKVIWGSEWDAVFVKDINGTLQNRLLEMLDGDFQYISTLTDPAAIRAKIAGDNAEIAALLGAMSDTEIMALRRGGHDREKIYAAYDRAIKADKPVCIIMHTVKGFTLGSQGEGQNTAHNTKKIAYENRVLLSKQYGIQNTEEEAKKADFYLPDTNSPEITYLHERRQVLGGYWPARLDRSEVIEMPDDAAFAQFYNGSGNDEPSTTLVFVRLLNSLVRDKKIGKLIVPIVPDEAQTFGMHPLFSSVGIYNPHGQQYQKMQIGAAAIQYTEKTNGQVLQEGINEAGAMASFSAAGSAYFLHGIPTIPFYIYYSMFGFQRVGDSIWATADQLGKGFLIGGTAGRTTLNGEGLQHEDGHSLLVAATVPSIRSYDPSFAYELAVIIKKGIHEMYVEKVPKIYYIMAYNENYVMPVMPKDVEGGITKGLYRFQKSKNKAKNGLKAHLLGSGSIMLQVLEAATKLEEMGISTDIWSATSYVEVARDCQATERRNLLRGSEKAEKSYFETLFAKEDGVIVCASDFMKSLPNSLAKWSPLDFTALGTDGFGLSESRPALREYFEINPTYIVLTVLNRLASQGKLDWKKVQTFIKENNISVDKFDPLEA